MFIVERWFNFILNVCSDGVECLGCCIYQSHFILLFHFAYFLSRILNVLILSHPFSLSLSYRRATPNPPVYENVVPIRLRWDVSWIICPCVLCGFLVMFCCMALCLNLLRCRVTFIDSVLLNVTIYGCITPCGWLDFVR